MKASWAVTGTRWLMVSETGWSVMYESPRSPVTASPSQVKYLTRKGSSRFRSSRICSSTPGSRGPVPKMVSTASPGIRATITKVKNVTANSVAINRSSMNAMVLTMMVAPSPRGRCRYFSSVLDHSETNTSCQRTAASGIPTPSSPDGRVQLLMPLMLGSWATMTAVPPEYQVIACSLMRTMIFE